MALVKVYHWKTYNVCTNESVVSRRMATRAAIKSFSNSAPIEDTETEADEAKLDANEMWTPLGQAC
jgi:hypothetical protein